MSSTSSLFFIFLFLIATLVCSSSLCGVVCLSYFAQVFLRFRLSGQLRFSADSINDFCVVNVANPET
ncbi:transmembrane protein, putative [Medicago truncatula]|uniref:Transmembrane protein, putative n=1 Tax=Medicago truncatula TaxID=3880 RepID=A0A072TLP3_MEDTR|nr:transmembrane protein, putative [Medicago truncatula]